MTTHTPAPPVPIHHHGSLWVRAVLRGSWTEYLLGADPGSSPQPARWAADLANFLAETGATLVELDAFGDAAATTTLRAALTKCLPAGFPASFLINPGNHAPLGGGLLARAVLGVPVTPVTAGTRTIGFRFADDSAAWCYLGALVAETTAHQNGATQTHEVMGRIKTALEASGMTFREVFRTWYYLHDILSWYDDFNHTRTAFFTAHDVFSRLMPASTGIGIANHAGLLPLAKVHACRPLTPATRIAVADSPLQGSAYDYGSAFSRAVTLTNPAGATLHISGTASIAPTGETEHAGDVRAQITRTMEVVDAMLRAADMTPAHTTRGIAYFHHAADLHLWETTRAAWQFPAHAIIAVHADICRHDLLFELELEAHRA